MTNSSKTMKTSTMKLGDRQLPAAIVTDFLDERDNKERHIPEGNRKCHVCNFTITYNTLKVPQRVIFVVLNIAQNGVYNT